MTTAISEALSDLLPCPLCGNADRPFVTDFDGEPLVLGYIVRCHASGWDGDPTKGCGCSTGWCETPEQAVAAWNRRHPLRSGNGGEVRAVTIRQLQAAHLARQDDWCPDQKPDLSFRGNEMAGEVGEACNVIKKLERERHGWRGSRDTAEHLGEELADVVHTAILCAITAGIDLDAAVVAKFNATSLKNDLPQHVISALDIKP